MSSVDVSDATTNLSPVDQQQISQVPPNIISTEASPVSPAQTHLNEKFPDPPPGMRYVLVPEQQPSSTSPQISFQAQQQLLGLPQCYACGAAAFERCFFWYKWFESL